MAQGTGTTAVGYIRVSTDDQADSGLSLEHQEARIRAYALANGLELVAIVRDEGVSAGKTFASRRGGATVAGLLAAGRARHVVALKLDRLFRNTADALTQATAWDRDGIGLHLIDVHGTTVNTRTAMGRMFFTMMAGFAELERGLISERTAAAMKVKKARGESVSGPTLGYDVIDGKLVANAEEQKLLARIMRLHAGGMSLGRIADRLNAEGIPTKRGGAAWHASTIQRLVSRAA